MKAPRKSTVEYVYAKLKTEVIRFIQSEIKLNAESDGEIYCFDVTEMTLYDMFSNNMIRNIENTEINYQAVVNAFEDDELPF